MKIYHPQSALMIEASRKANEYSSNDISNDNHEAGFTLLTLNVPAFITSDCS